MPTPYDIDSYVKLVFPGDPVPQQRPRLYRRGSQNIVFDPNSREKNQFKLIAQEQMEKLDNWQMPEYPRIHFWFYMPIPKSMDSKSKPFAEKEILKHNKKPDIDNLIKLYLDVIVDVALRDDNCVSIGRAIKLYSPHPRTEMFIEECDKIVTNKELYG